MSIPFTHTDNTENVPGFTASMAEVESAAHALWIASMNYRATPHFPQCLDLLKARWEQYEESLAAMREVLK